MKKTYCKINNCEYCNKKSEYIYFVEHILGFNFIFLCYECYKKEIK
jgi:hypothetical protein